MKQVIKEPGILTFLSIVISIMLSNCASGPKFTAATSTKYDKALIYVYRKSSMVGAAGFDKVYVNQNLFTTLRSGGYAPYEVSPGIVSFSLTARMAKSLGLTAVITNTDDQKNEKLKINAEPGRTYFIKLYVTGSGHELKVVDSATGIKEIRGLHLSKVAGDK